MTATAGPPDVTVGRSRVDLAVRGGTIVTESGRAAADVLVSDGRISALVTSGTEVSADEVVDATGLLVLPGLVDAHCHFDTFSHHVDDLASLSAAALAGGVTTIVPFLIPGGREGQPETLAAILDHFIEEGRRNSVVDFGFHVALWPRWEAVEEIEACVERGCSSFKMFMALPRLSRMVPDDLLVACMERISACDALAMVHAENGLVADYLERTMSERGERAPTQFGRSRPTLVEAEATARAIALSRVAGSDLYVVHVTCSEAVEHIARARRRDLPVLGETCPQYLALDESAMERWGPLAKVAPPLRHPDEPPRLWGSLRRGELSTVGSDHSAHLRATKERGRDDVFGDVPFGAAMIETMLPVLYSEGVAGGRIGLERLVAVTSANPARTFGLHPRKGTVQPGADADLLLLDPASTTAVTAERQHHNSDYSLFEGSSLQGAIRLVIAAGRVAVRDGEITDAVRPGRYVARPASRVPSGLL